MSSSVPTLRVLDAVAINAIVETIDRATGIADSSLHRVHSHE